MTTRLMPFCLPYCAKAKIEHNFDVDHLDIYLTFAYPMRRETDLLANPPVYDWYPTLDHFVIETDGDILAAVAAEWLDCWTLKLTSDEIVALPNQVTVEYLGPDEHLTTTWHKQWEPWGPIVSLDITT